MFLGKEAEVRDVLSTIHVGLAEVL